MVEVLRGAGVSFALKISGTIMQFVFSVLLARLLGVEDTGLFYLALSICTVAWMLGCFGLQNTILRYVASYASKFDWGGVMGVYNRSIIFSSIASLFLMFILYLFSPFLANSIFSKPELASPMRFMSLAIWPMSMVLLHSDSLKGLKKIRNSQLVNGVIPPACALCFLCVVGNYFGLFGVIGAHLAGSVLALVTGVLFWRRAVPAPGKAKINVSNSQILSSCLPLLIVTLSYMVMQWSSTFALGVWGTKADIGVFSLSLRTANLMNFILVSVNSIVAPKFSELYSCGDMTALENVACKSTLFMLLVACPILLVFVFFPNYIMAVFGEGFEGGGYILTIIAIGQFVNVATGSVGYLLMMSGNEKLMRNNAIFIALITICLNFLLVPTWGVVGAALVSALSMSAINVVSFVLVWKSLGIVVRPRFTSVA